MKIINFFTLLLALIFMISCSNREEQQNKNGQETSNQKTGKGKDTRKPMEIARLISNNVVENTKFELKYLLKPYKPAFNFVRSVDFGKTYQKDQPAIAYAVTGLYSEKDTTFTMEISHNDAIQLFLDGNKVYQRKGSRPLDIKRGTRSVYMDDQFSLTVKKGYNELMIKSETDGKGEWKCYIQRKGAKKHSQDHPGLELGVMHLPNVDSSLHDIAPFMVTGPFPSEGNNNLSKKYPPEEKGFVVAELFKINGKRYIWEMPEVSMISDVYTFNPVTGAYDSWVYTGGGISWAFSKLSEKTGNPEYDQWAQNFYDLWLNKQEFVKYQVEEMEDWNSLTHYFYDTPLLDFTTAPSLGLAYRLIHDKPFKDQQKAKRFFKKIIDYAMNEQYRLPNGTFTRKTPVKYTTWLDDSYMGPPFVCLAGKYTGKTKYYDEAAQQLLGFHELLWNDKKELYHHAYESKTKELYPHWSRANGWMVLGVSSILEILPKDHKNYDKIMKHYKAHIDGLIKYQAESGFWHNVLDHPDTYEETSGTAMFTLGIARAINNEWFKGKKYQKAVRKGWKAVKSATKDNGKMVKVCIGTGLPKEHDNIEHYATRPTIPGDPHALVPMPFLCMEMAELLNKKDS